MRARATPRAVSRPRDERGARPSRRLALVDARSGAIDARARAARGLEARRAPHDAGIACHDPLQLVADRRGPLAGDERRGAASSPADRPASMPRSTPGGVGRRPCRRRWPRRRARANTRPSSSEFDASRLAPCTPVHATSPHAHRPGSVVAPSRSVHDAAAQVVRGGRDRQPVARGVETDARHARPDRREALGEVVDAGGVEPHVVEAALEHAAADRRAPRRRVARGRRAGARRP